MPFLARKIDVIAFSLDHTPGALAKVYRALKEAGISVKASWGYQMGPTGAAAQIFVDDTAKARAIVERSASDVRVRQAVWLEGDDDVGVYLEALEVLAQGGVNIDASDAYAIGGKFAGGLFFAEGDAAAGFRALGL